MIPLTAEEREYVYGDDEQIVTEYHGKRMEILGNQIQMINVSFVESGDYRRFGTVEYGMGNNGRDGLEGVMYRNSVFTNMLGPALVNNPWFTCEIIKAAAEAAGKTLSDTEPEFELEKKSLESKKLFIKNKEPGSMGL
jgi:hypothetical protein